MDEPRWVPRLVVETIHFLQLVEHGGLRGVRDEGLLDASLARPHHQWTYEPDADIPSLAAAYAWAILRNHPFRDGNKRVAFLTAVTFLGLNGYHLTAPEADVVAVMLDAAASEIDEGALVVWFRRTARPAR